MSRPQPHGAPRRNGRPSWLLALALTAFLALSACSAGSGPAIVTITTTAGASGTAPVTAPSLSSTPPDGSPGTGSSPQPGTSTSSSPAVPAMRVTAEPSFGSKRVGPNEPVRVTVFNAVLEQAEMTGDDGSTIAGEISDDEHTWASTGTLKYGVTYTIAARAKGLDGAERPIKGLISTVKPDETMPAYIQIPDGATVGIASPIVVTFAGAVKDRAAAEKQLHVTINGGDAIEGSWGWMQDEDIQNNGVKQSRVHFRPKDYWPAGAKVHVEADLYGVNYGSGWGREKLVRDFTIGPKIVVKADVDSHRLLVIKDDEIIKNYPVSYGVPATKDAGRTTVSGIHVITEKKPGEFTMSNPKYGYHDVKEYWGVRINNNGEFIHVNKETEALGLLGKANVSHGCVNMGMRDGEEFFNMVYYGIPVDVEGTGVKMSYSDYIWDWSVSYDQWKSFSAL